jgi:hypothetical protein
MSAKIENLTMQLTARTNGILIQTVTLQETLTRIMRWRGIFNTRLWPCIGNTKIGCSMDFENFVLQWRTTNEKRKNYSQAEGLQ